MVDEEHCCPKNVVWVMHFIYRPAFRSRSSILEGTSAAYLVVNPGCFSAQLSQSKPFIDRLSCFPIQGGGAYMVTMEKSNSKFGLIVSKSLVDLLIWLLIGIQVWCRCFPAPSFCILFTWISVLKHKEPGECELVKITIPMIFLLFHALPMDLFLSNSNVNVPQHI